MIGQKWSQIIDLDTKQPTEMSPEQNMKIVSIWAHHAIGPTRFQINKFLYGIAHGFTEHTNQQHDHWRQQFKTCFRQKNISYVNPMLGL